MKRNMWSFTCTRFVLPHPTLFFSRPAGFPHVSTSATNRRESTIRRVDDIEFGEYFFFKSIREIDECRIQIQTLVFSISSVFSTVQPSIVIEGLTLSNGNITQVPQNARLRIRFEQHSESAISTSSSAQEKRNEIVSTPKELLVFILSPSARAVNLRGVSAPLVANNAVGALPNADE